MSISSKIKESMTSKSAGVIRKMFEEGLKLKSIHGQDNVFDFSIGNPDLDPPEEVMNAIEKFGRCRERNFHGYMPNAGFPFAREAMAEKTSAEQGTEVHGDSVVMSVGAAVNLLLARIDLSYGWQEYGVELGDKPVDSFTVKVILGYDK